jgi:hypothetical protein
MYEVDKHIRCINNINFVTYSRTIKENNNELEVEAGSYSQLPSSVYYGNDSGISYIRIKNKKGITKFSVNPIGYNGSDGVEIVIYGSVGISLLLIGLKFIRKALLHCIEGKIF